MIIGCSIFQDHYISNRPKNLKERPEPGRIVRLWNLPYKDLHRLLLVPLPFLGQLLFKLSLKLLFGLLQHLLILCFPLLLVLPRIFRFMRFLVGVFIFMLLSLECLCAFFCFFLSLGSPLLLGFLSKRGGKRKRRIRDTHQRKDDERWVGFLI